MVDGGADPYDQLKSRLFALIVEHRIYREEHLLQLFDKVITIITAIIPARDSVTNPCIEHNRHALLIPIWIPFD